MRHSQVHFQKTLHCFGARLTSQKTLHCFNARFLLQAKIELPRLQPQTLPFVVRKLFSLGHTSTMRGLACIWKLPYLYTEATLQIQLLL
jgi:hypothetical protein